MKTIGLIGGIGSASTKIYYDTITKHLRKRLGPNHTGYIVLYSIDEYDIYTALKKKDYEKVSEILIKAAKVLEKAKVDVILICSNLFNGFADIVQKNCKVPLLHILIPICDVINKAKYKQVGFIGTEFTSTQGFYSNYLLKNSNAKKVITPELKQIADIDAIIFKELLDHKVNRRSKAKLIKIINSMDIDCLILACTELSLILSQADLDIPVLDSTKLHAIAAAEYILAKAPPCIDVEIEIPLPAPKSPSLQASL